MATGQSCDERAHVSERIPPWMHLNRTSSHEQIPGRKTHPQGNRRTAMRRDLARQPAQLVDSRPSLVLGVHEASQRGLGPKVSQQ